MPQLQENNISVLKQEYTEEIYEKVLSSSFLLPLSLSRPVVRPHLRGTNPGDGFEMYGERETAKWCGGGLSVAA